MPDWVELDPWAGELPLIIDRLGMQGIGQGAEGG